MRIKLCTIVLGALLLTGAGCSLGSSIGSVENNSESRHITSESFQDYNGNRVSLKDFEGEYIVVNAWATWCPFCTKELSEFASVQKAFGDKVTIISVNRKESLKRSKEFTDELGVTDELLFLTDPKDTFYKSIGGFSMPETVFVNKTGEIVHHKRGPVNEEQFTKLIEQLISDQLNI